MPRAPPRARVHARSPIPPPAQAEREDATTDDGTGVNAAPVLNSALKKLHDDAYLCLEVEAGCEPNAIKKAYRKIALQYHPDKNKNRTGLLFTTARSRDALSVTLTRRRAARDLVTRARARRAASPRRPPAPPPLSLFLLDRSSRRTRC